MKKILVVDDDTDLLVALKSFFTKKGYDIAVSTTCEDGYLLISSFKPEMILLDAKVGTQDGRVMCQRIKSQAQYKHIPVVFISANQEAVKLYRNYGANASLGKPFELSELETIIASFKGEL
jgi:DNA-binding response OmpR family regulator